MRLNQSITQLITSISTLIGVFIMMINNKCTDDTYYTYYITCKYLIRLVSVIETFTTNTLRVSRNILGHVNGQVEEVYGGHNIVKAFNKEEDCKDQYIS
ncbi:MAG: hypothetical protein ACLTST_08575 [Lachnospiraceae bacterium]